MLQNFNKLKLDKNNNFCIFMINNVVLREIDVPIDNKLKEKGQEPFISVFDVHSNGVVDSGDFTLNDLKNNFIKDFLDKYLNQKWSLDLENLIKPFLNAQNEENFQTKLHGYEVKYEKNIITFRKGGKTYEIKVEKDSTVIKTDIEILFDIIKGFSPDVLNDFLLEINGIKLADEINFGGRGFFGDNTIELSSKENSYGINKYTLIHELGHGVSYMMCSNKYGKEQATYSFLKELKNRFNNFAGIEKLMQKLKDEFGCFNRSNNQEYGDGYALRSIYEFFAEYYLYKKEGQTGHSSEKLFNALEKSSDKEYQDLLKIMENSLKIAKRDEEKRKTN